MSPRALAVLALAASLAGCFSDRPTAPGGDVTFASDIQTIFTGSCAFSGCHGSSGANPSSKPMVLESGRAYDAIVGVASAQAPSMPRITPGDPNRSYLIHKLQGTHTLPQVGGFGARMPIGNPLSSATMDLLRQWVSEGAQRN